MKKEIKRFNVQELKERRDTVVTMKFNKKNYMLFKEIMKEQKLVPSAVIDQFMKLTNDLLQSSEGGEVVFVFEPDKNEEDSSK